jgi:hemerythrin
MGANMENHSRVSNVPENETQLQRVYESSEYGFNSDEKFMRLVEFTSFVEDQYVSNSISY